MPSAQSNWPDLLRNPPADGHFVQVYQDPVFLCQAVCEYLRTGLSRGEGAIIIARPSHTAAFVQQLENDGVAARDAIAAGQLVMLDAEETLARFTAQGMPDWQSFHALIGGVIAKLRLNYPAVRAYGEMVDLLWQRGERDAALRVEEFWNDIAKLQTFSLLCAYAMDPLDPTAYGGPLECVCRVHTHLIPAHDYGRFNEAVLEASRDVLDQPLSDMLLSMAQRHAPSTEMPQGQATLLWLKRNMPRTADKVLTRARQRLGASSA